MDYEIETIKNRETKLFAIFCFAAAVIGWLFSCLTVWVTAVLSIVGIALFILDLWYNGKMNGMAIVGLVVSVLGLCFSAYIIVLSFIDEAALVEFELWLEKSLGISFVDPLF